MMKTSLAVAALLASGAAMAQTCACSATATAVTTQASLATLLGNKMVCGNVGGEVWQEWHNGSSSGPVVDYKKGPSDPVDPSEPVGTYQVNANATVTYTYGGTPYTYSVCSTNPDYVFCGAAFGGRDITGVRIGGAGLASCVGITSSNSRATIRK